MIHFCTCSRGSASTLELSRKRVGLASCKICGGKPLVDGRESLTGSMLSAVGLELTSVTNTDLPWKAVSKGNRSAPRRARKLIARSTEGSEKPIARSLEGSDKDSKKAEDMPVSESEKLGVSVLGRRFSDKIEHVPIKKRRFLFRSPSPPPQVSSPHAEESGWRINSEPTLGQKESTPNSTVKERVMAIATAVANELGLVVSADIVDGKNSKKIHAKLDDHEDFSGISILAAAACNHSIEGGTGNVEEGSLDEGSYAPEGTLEVPVKSESCSVVEGSCRDQSHNYPEISNGGISLCVSAVPIEETIISPETTKDTNNNPATTSSNVVDGNSMGIPFSPGNSVSVSQSLASNKDDGAHKRLESGSRDGRFHWDLNVVMDAWENPCEDPIVDSQASSVYGSDDGMHCEKVQSETGDSIYAIERNEQAMVGSGVSVGVQKVTGRPEDSKSLVPVFGESYREVPKMDACTSSDQTSCFQERVPSMEIDNAVNSVMDLVEGAKPMCIEERINSNEESVVSSLVEHTQEHSTFVNTATVSDQKASSQSGSFCTTENHEILSPHQVVIEDAHVECHFTCTEAVNITSKSLIEESRDETSQIDLCKQTEDNCVVDVSLSAAKISKRASLDGVDIEGNPGVIGEGYVPKMTIGDTQVSPNCQELSTSGASVGKGECVVVADAKVQDMKVSNMDGEVLSTTEVASLQIDSEEVKHKVLRPIPAAVEKPLAIGSVSSHEACKSYYDPVNSSGKVAIEEDPFDDSDYESDVSHNDPVHVPEIEKAIELEEGNESQYEDGELREPIGHNWEEDAGYGGEPEHVDYGSDNKDTYGFEAPEDYERDQFRERNSQEAKIMDSKVDRESSAGVDKESNQLASARMKLSGWDKLPEGCQSSSNMIFEDKEVSGKKGDTSVQMNVMDSKDSTTGMVGSTASRRNLPSCVEGPTSSQMLLGKDKASLHANRSNNFDDPNSRIEMDTGSTKSIGRGGSSLNMHGRGRGNDRWVDSPRGNWDKNRHHSPSYYGPANFVHPGTKNAAAAAAAAAAKVVSNGFIVASDGTIIKAGGICAGPSGRVQRQSANGSTQVGQRAITRRGSPAERDEGFGMPMGLGPVGEISPDRSTSAGRSRSGRYGPRVVRAGPRERYHGSGPDEGIDSSLCLQHPLSRREHSFSPIHRRGAPHLSHSFTRSRSRSRTRSPHMWSSPRGRNGGYGPGLRQCSRSPPNFRSETRMDRVRSPPHRRPGYGADHIGGFGSTPRNRGSPPHSSRWSDDRKDSLDHFRENGYKQRSSVSERSSPGRVMRRSHRDLVDSSVRLRPDEYYNRPMHPGRFPEMIEAGRGPRYDGSDEDKRKQGERYGMFHHGRRFHAEEPVNRFRYDVEDGFAVHNSRNKDISGFHGRGDPKEAYVRGIDNRLGDASRRGREDKGHFRYDRDGKYNANSKSFGIRECEDDIAPRRRRPS